MRRTYKNMLSKLIRDEKGQALILALILLLVGGLISVPTLSLMSTGLKSGSIQETNTRLLYAADAGIEDALWKIHNWAVSLDPYDYVTEYTYNLADEINGDSVMVTIQNVWPLDGLEVSDFGTLPHAELVVVGDTVNEETGEYKIEITYDGSIGELKIDRVGAWLPYEFEYCNNSTSGITEDNPTITDRRGGKALIWDFHPAVTFADLPEPPPPEPPPGGFEPATEYPMKRSLTFYFSPTMKPVGTFSWVRTNRHDIYLCWDTGTCHHKLTSTATDMATGKQITVESYALREELQKENVSLQGDYRAIGNTLMLDLVPDHGGPKRDELVEQSDAYIYNDDIPADAEVVWAYLYWSAWKEQERQGNKWLPMEADREVSFAVNDQQVCFNSQGEPVVGDNDIAASKWWIIENEPHTYSYSCFKDVTELVKLISPRGNGKYTVGGVDGDTDDEWSYAGWSLVIVYSSPTEVAHQVYIYDNFLYSDMNTTHTFNITGFEAPEDAEAKLTCFVGEGDEYYDGDWIKFNGTDLPDSADGVYDNVWNGKFIGLGEVEEVDGVDIDTFDVSSPTINEGDTWAEVVLGTGVDSWNLVYIILSFTTDISGVGLKPNIVGSITYDIR